MHLPLHSNRPYLHNLSWLFEASILAMTMHFCMCITVITALQRNHTRGMSD
jgi:hypothetical protein